MAITVTPEEFTLVLFEHQAIVDVLERLVPTVGLPAGADVTLNIDERVPTGIAEVVSIDPIVIAVEGGALENPRFPRQLSDAGTADIVGRLLWRVRDRLDPAFGQPPSDDDLSLAHKSAWDTYCVGRLARHGYRSQRQRRIYSFRNRHGFTDVADAAFETLWTADQLTWADIERLSDQAVAARDAVATSVP